ncbi:MAG: hypothetical protein ACO3ZG_07165 [Kiritimatiellia bacterium]|jgi:hypothetical protein
MRLSGLTSLLITATVMITAACATQRIIVDDKPIAETRLFVTRSADKVNLSWQSQPHEQYTLLFNSTRSAKTPWRVVPGGEQIQGNGLMIMLTDHVPAREERFYRLQTLPLTNRR